MLRNSAPNDCVSPTLTMPPSAPLPRSDKPASLVSNRIEAAAQALRRRDDRDPVAGPTTNMRTLLDKLPGMVVCLERAAAGNRWSVSYASQEFAVLCGLRLQAMRDDARPLAQRVHPDDWAALQQAWARGGAAAVPLAGRLRLRLPDGHWASFDVSAVVDRTADGGTLWNLLLTDTGSARLASSGAAAPVDTTGRTGADPTANTPTGAGTDSGAAAELQRQYDRWRRATAAADVGVVDINLLTGALLLDPVACQHHGLDSVQAQWGFDAWLDRVVVTDRQAARTLLAVPALRDERTRLTLTVNAGEPLGRRTLEFVLQSVVDEMRLVGTCVDVTERQTLDALKRDKLDAENANRSKSEFMSRVSHELRTPLNGILGFAQLMALDADHPLPPAQAQRLDMLRHSGARLLSLIDQLLDVSRIEQGRMRMRNRPVNVASLVERCAAQMMPLAQSCGVELMVQIPASAKAVRGDPDALEQVVTNLLSNAIKYNRPSAGRVRVRFEAGEQGVLTVDDTGIGMSGDQLEKLFEPFNRLGAERTNTQGSGLGLTITRKLVRAMGGKIDVLSRPGRGTRFAVSLPLAKTGAAKPTAELNPDRPAAMAQPSLWDEGIEQVVLYVEDDEVNTILMEQIFRSQPNWRLITAATGPEGLALAQQHELSLVMLDLNLPGLSGFDILERLKADDSTRHLRCVALSADALPHQIQHALSLGFDDYWTKPIDVAVVISKLKDEFRMLAEAG
jgi:signal transduction histidine kinase/ActR/RegA family two-component response regulator